MGGTFDVCVLHQLGVVDVSSLLQAPVEQRLHHLRSSRSGGVLHQHLRQQQQSSLVAIATAACLSSLWETSQTNWSKELGSNWVCTCSSNSNACCSSPAQRLWEPPPGGSSTCGELHLWEPPPVGSSTCGLLHLWAPPPVGSATCGLLHLWAAPPADSRPERWKQETFTRPEELRLAAEGWVEVGGGARTRSCRASVALRAPSGRPKGKQYLQTGWRWSRLLGASRTRAR